jgi:hypothetical protein
MLRTRLFLVGLCSSTHSKINVQETHGWLLVELNSHIPGIRDRLLALHCRSTSSSIADLQSESLLRRKLTVGPRLDADLYPFESLVVDAEANWTRGAEPMTLVKFSPAVTLRGD